MPLDPADVDAIAKAVAVKLGTARECLLDREALAERLGIGERTVGAMVARGELPRPLLHTGGIARWHWPQVLQFLAGRQDRRLRRGRGRFGREMADGRGGRPSAEE